MKGQTALGETAGHIPRALTGAMKWFAIFSPVALVLAGCGGGTSHASAGTTVPPASSTTVDPITAAKGACVLALQPWIGYIEQTGDSGTFMNQVGASSPLFRIVYTEAATFVSNESLYGISQASTTEASSLGQDCLSFNQSNARFDWSTIPPPPTQ